MAKQPSTNGKKKAGPHLAAAVFCDRVLEEKQDGSLSVVRIIDTITCTLHPLTPEDVPSEKNRLPIQISGLISFKTGDAPGEHTIKVVAESPSGKKTKPVFERTVPFSSDPQGGFNLRLNSVLSVMKGGLFWFHIFLDGKRVARMPLMVKIERAETPQIVEPKTDTTTSD